MPSAHAVATATDILCQLISIPSVNPMGPGAIGPTHLEGRLSDWLVEFFKSFGAAYERITVSPGRDNVIALLDPPDAGGASRPLTLLLDAHQDTAPVDGMTIPPFDPQVRDGRVSGRGAADVKGGLAAMLFAFRRLVVERPTGAARVVLSCTCDEEAGATGIKDLVRCWREPGRSRLLTSPPDGAIVAEPTQLNVVVAHRGVTRFHVYTRGRACHSSDPSRGVNAIYRMSRVVAYLEEYANLIGRTSKPHPLCGNATVSVGRIVGGSGVNVVPDECAIEVERRVIPGENLTSAVADLKQFVASRVDFPVEFGEPWIESPPLSDTNNAWLAEPLLDCVARLCGSRRAIGVPFCTHASPTSAAGVPTVVFGPGSIEQAHTPDEFIEIDQLEQAAAVYFDLCAHPPRRHDHTA